MHIIYEEAINGFEINRITRMSAYNMPSRHIHKECEFYYLLKGERDVVLGEQSYRVRHGELVIVGSNVAHQTKMTTEPYHERIQIEVESDVLQEEGDFCEFDVAHFFEEYNGVLKLSAEEQRIIEYKLEEIEQELHNKESGYKRMAKIKFIELLRYIKNEKKDYCQKEQVETGGNVSRQKALEIAQYIQANYKDKLSLDKIARHFYLNKSYVSRIFKETTRFTVNEYINIQKVTHAKEMLERTDDTIAELSEYLGFENVNYFDRIFYRFAETTPSRYRKQYRQIKESIRPKKKEV